MWIESVNSNPQSLLVKEDKFFFKKRMISSSSGKGDLNKDETVDGS
jgi:hypothetical protein